ncbi:post-transcriptional regulator [Salimicrobium halophilum]|uniref:Post-transcriptional regulator n=1 Tax=Salimicrobium halophilum TaxID=86666 RepID=A0A1G8PL61_9BACI|nr:post-transcriptional regulator [Salimicrobium halophilum]SDI93234.1 Post-transcriptional regulator [Salimicrobium halophilum]
MEEKHVQEWRSYIDPALESKKQEFLLLGYSTATKEEIWNCLNKKVWKKNKQKRLHAVVQDVFRLQPHTYLSYVANQIYQNDDLKASLEAVTKGF